MTGDPTTIRPLDLDAKIIQLNKDLAPIAEEIAALVQRFNEETHGHAADVSLRCDWNGYKSYDLPLGLWQLVRVELGAKHMHLPGPAR